MSPGTVSNLNKKIYAKIEEWRHRPIEGDHMPGRATRRPRKKAEAVTAELRSQRMTKTADSLTKI